MKNFFNTPEKSFEYLKVSLIRLAISFFLLYALLHVTQMWPGFEDNVLLLAGLAIIYHFIVYLVKRNKGKKL